VLGTLFAGGQRPSKEQIDNARGNGHEVSETAGESSGKPAEGIVSRRRKREVTASGISSPPWSTACATHAQKI
jgi:hypothetical protein